MDSSGFDRLDRVVSFGAGAFSGVDSRDTGRLDPLLASFLTVGVLGFFGVAPFLTGVALDGGVVSALETDFFLPDFLAEDTAFLAGDFFTTERPLPLALA